MWRLSRSRLRQILLYFKIAVTEFASQHTEAKSAGQRSVNRHCYLCGQRQIQGEMWGMHPPPVNFKHVFDEHSFSIISNLFDNNKPYAPSAHNRKYTNKMHYMW